MNNPNKYVIVHDGDEYKMRQRDDTVRRMRGAGISMYILFASKLNMHIREDAEGFYLEYCISPVAIAAQKTVDATVNK